MNDKEQKTILLVEDEAIIAMAEVKILQNYGYKTITANTGEKAVQIVNKVPNIALILMDIDLGKEEIDGTQATEIILGKHNIPLIFLSSHKDCEVVEKNS